MNKMEMMSPEEYACFEEIKELTESGWEYKKYSECPEGFTEEQFINDIDIFLKKLDNYDIILMHQFIENDKHAVYCFIRPIL